MRKKPLKTNNGLVLSRKSNLQLTKEELEQLQHYVDTDAAAYTNIKNNAGIHRDTIVDTLKRGYLQADPALRLRAFLKAIKVATV